MVLFSFSRINFINSVYRDDYQTVAKMNKIFFFLSGFKEGMRQFGQTISIIINSGLLLIVYFIGIGFTSIIAKLFHKHFLDLNLHFTDY